MEFTYENQGVNTFLTWKLKKQDKLDELIKGMMENNEISGILPLAYSRNNLDRYIKYNISSKVTLKQYFSGTLGRKSVISAMRSITNAIMEANEYMIEISQLLLDMEYIYINVSTAQIGLLVLPVEQTGREYDLRGFFRNMVLHVQFDPNENGNYIALILNFLNGSTAFSLTEFKKMLDTQFLERDMGDTGRNQQEPVRREAGVYPAGAFSSIQQKSVIEPVRQAAVPVQAPAQKKGKRTAKPVKVKEKKKEKEKRGFFGKRKSKKKEEVAEFQGAFAVPGQEKLPGTSTPAINQPGVNQPMPQVSGIPGAMPQQPKPAMQEIDASFGETTVLSQGISAETSVLTPGAGGADLKPYVLWKRKNQKVYLNKPEFRMGKEQNYVDICVTENAAVSRSHADIITRNGACFIRDNNSLNHTFLDGKQVKSGSEAQLEHGAKFQLADEEFEFRLY